MRSRMSLKLRGPCTTRTRTASFARSMVVEQRMILLGQQEFADARALAFHRALAAQKQPAARAVELLKAPNRRSAPRARRRNSCARVRGPAAALRARSSRRPRPGAAQRLCAPATASPDVRPRRRAEYCACQLPRPLLEKLHIPGNCRAGYPAIYQVLALLLGFLPRLRGECCRRQRGGACDFVHAPSVSLAKARSTPPP